MNGNPDFILIDLDEEIACPADREHRFRLRDGLGEATVQRRQRDLVEERARFSASVRASLETDLARGYEEKFAALTNQLQELRGDRERRLAKARDELELVRRQAQEDENTRASVRERLWQERFEQQSKLLENLTGQLSERSREGVELLGKVAVLQAEKDAAVARAISDTKANFGPEIARQAEQTAREKYQTELDGLKLKQVELEKQRDDARQAAEDLQRRMEQGSQQLQGEALELVLERELRTRFPLDHVVSVAKGMHGADVLQTVVGTDGRSCGTITWETKNAQNWNPRWLEKVRKDMIAGKSEFGVLVSTVLPPPVRHFEQMDGIWVCDLTALSGLATVLRHQVISLAYARSSADGRDQKMNVLYRYLTGPEFRERVNAVMQIFIQMQATLEREKRAISSQWSIREKQIDGVLDSLGGMYGDLQGIIGSSSLPSIPVLDIETNPELNLGSGGSGGIGFSGGR
jgi:hypothetical protein